MEVALLLLTVFAALLLLGVVARFVVAITAVVEHFGSGSDCDLAKIGWGVRAIDRETAILPSGIAELNQQLRLIRDGLAAIDRSVVAATQAQQ